MKTPQLLTPDQAAARLQVARTTVLDMLRAKRLVGVKVGPQWRVEPSALDRYIEAQRQCPPADPAPVAPPPARTGASSLAQQLMPKTRRFS